MGLQNVVGFKNGVELAEFCRLVWTCRQVLSCVSLQIGVVLCGFGTDVACVSLQTFVGLCVLADWCGLVVT